MRNERFEIRKSHKNLVDVVSDHWDEPIEYLCDEMSPRGAFLRTNFPLCEGEVVAVSFNLPGTRRDFAIFGRVVRIDLKRRRRDAARCGMAVEFLDATGVDRLLIRQALRKAPPVIPAYLKEKGIDIEEDAVVVS